MSTAPETMGPIGYLIVEFPQAHRFDGRALAQLVELVDRGFIRVLDLVFVRKDESGVTAVVDLGDLSVDDFDVAVFDGASSGLLGADEAASAGAALEAGATGAILIYENRWAAPFVDTLRRSDAQLVAAGFIPLDDIVAALDAADGAGA